MENGICPLFILYILHFENFTCWLHLKLDLTYNMLVVFENKLFWTNKHCFDYILPASIPCIIVLIIVWREKNVIENSVEISCIDFVPCLFDTLKYTLICFEKRANVLITLRFKLGVNFLDTKSVRVFKCFFNYCSVINTRWTWFQELSRINLKAGVVFDLPNHHQEITSVNIIWNNPDRQFSEKNY